MNPNHSERTKDERWEIRRLAKRVRGIYTAEQQALNFVADAQTQSRGVCSQSIKRHAADYGYNDRHIQWGLHGRRRSGKLEYVGLIARRIVYVAGGYPKGGRAAGGAGLTPDYAINLEEMLKFIPEMDDDSPEPPKKGEPLGEPMGEPSEKKGEPLGDLMRTSSLSSSLSPASVVNFSDDSAAGDEAAVRSGAAAPSQSLPFTYGDIAISGDSPRCSSQPATQTEPPSAVTCEQVHPSAVALDEQRMGQRIQLAVSRIAKAKLQNYRRIPKNLTVKFELLAMAHGVNAVSGDFGKWCDENPAAKREMSYPIHEYIKVVDERFSARPAENPNAAGVDELSTLVYDLTNILPTKKQKRQVGDCLKEFPVATLKTALTYFVGHLPEDPTSGTMTEFWTPSNIYAVLKVVHKMCEATEGNEDLRKVKPMQHDLQALKRNVGTLPFTQRLTLSHQGYSSCPFHDGDGEKSFHIERKDDGVGIGTCFSDCAKTFDAIAFVEKFDKVSTGDAIRKLVSLVGNIENGLASAQLPPKPKPFPMTTEAWAKSGREVTNADVAKLAASRPTSVTPSAATLNAMGFKMGNDVFLSAAYRMGDNFYTIKGRNITVKKFLQENAISQHGLFNIDAVTEGCDVYVVESELDAAVLHEHGFIAVSVVNAQQRQIEPEVLKKLLTARRIFLIGDSDTAGTTCMDAIVKLLPAEKVNRLSVPVGVKDVGEWATSAQFQKQFAQDTQPVLIGAKS